MPYNVINQYLQCGSELFEVLPATSKVQLCLPSCPINICLVGFRRYTFDVILYLILSVTFTV